MVASSSVELLQAEWDGVGLAREAKANERAFQARVRTVLRASYSNHYPRMLPPLLAALSFGCYNTAYRSVMAAVELLAATAGWTAKPGSSLSTTRFHSTVWRPGRGWAWRAVVIDDRGRVERIPYELCVLVAPLQHSRQIQLASRAIPIVGVVGASSAA